MHYGMSAMDVSHNPQTRKPHLYGTWRWQKKRKAFLKANPICVMCYARGIVTVARVADHIEPHKGDEAKFWNGALQALCAMHHNSDKQRIERGSKPKPITGEDGWPV
jgi:5-methylcytosine-specific restriction protein A